MDGLDDDYDGDGCDVGALIVAFAAAAAAIFWMDLGDMMVLE